MEKTIVVALVSLLVFGVVIGLAAGHGVEDRTTEGIELGHEDCHEHCEVEGPDEDCWELEEHPCDMGGDWHRGMHGLMHGW